MANIPIKPWELPSGTPVANASIVGGNGSVVQKYTPAQIVDVAAPLASQVDAETGTGNDNRMSALRVKQAIDAQAVLSADLASSVPGKGASLVKLERGGTVQESITGSVQKNLSGNYYSGGPPVYNNAVVPAAIKLVPKSGSTWDKGIFQGFTFVPEPLRFYTAWDEVGGGALSIMRQSAAGAFELASSDAQAYIGHGQTLLHFHDRDGNLKLVADGTDGQSIVIFDPPATDGGAIGNPKTYQLVPSGWVVGFPGPHADRKKVVFNAWDASRSDNPYYTRIFDLQSLLDGPEGDRSGEYISDTNIAPKNEYWSGAPAPTIQGVAADADNVYIVQSTDNTSDTAYLSCFSIALNKRMWRLPFTVGKAFAATKGAGIRYEVEGLAWVANGAGVPKLWAGIRTRNNDDSGSDMYAMPLEALDIGSAPTARSPLQVGLWGGGQTYDLLVPAGEVWGVSRYSGPDTAPVDCFRISGTLGRTYSLENHYVGTEQTLTPSLVSNITGLNLLGALGRVVVSANGLVGNWQRQSGDGNIHEFRHGTTLVGSISVTSSATAFNTSSDATLKIDNGELSYDDALSIVRLVTIHNFDWKADGSSDVGVFAQELYEVYPRAVTVGGWYIEDEEGVQSPANEGDDGAIYRPWAVDYSKLVPVMFRVMQGLVSA